MSPAVGDLLAGPILSWVPQLTLLILLASQPWRVYMPAGSGSHLAGLAATVAVTTALVTGVGSTSAWFWCLLATVHFTWVASAYVAADNHHYLAGYWCVAVAGALHTGGSEGERQLAQNAGVLIGLCFALAVLAKLASRAYRTGGFFVWTLVTDVRFLALATFVGGMSAASRREHLVALAKVRSGASSRECVPVPARLRRLAIGLTWWTVAIESLVAVLFLIPPSATLDILRVLCLAVFAITTFALVAVPSFGQILLLMLLAATRTVELRWPIVLMVLSLTIVSFATEMLKRCTIRWTNVPDRLGAGHRTPVPYVSAR